MALNVQSTQQALVDLVNSNNVLKVTLKQVKLSAPEPNVTTNDGNTQVKFESIPGNGVIGDRDVFYNRLTQAQAFGGSIYKTFTFDPLDCKTEDEIVKRALREFAQQKNIPVDQPGELTDIRYESVDDDGEIAGIVRASADVSYVLRGELIIHVMNKYPSLSHALKVKRLNAFNVKDVVPGIKNLRLTAFTEEDVKPPSSKKITFGFSLSDVLPSK